VNVRYDSLLAKVILPRRFIAITLGETVFTRLPSLTPAALRHERVHVEQWRRFGRIGFPLRYIWSHLKHGYHANPFEVEARAAEQDPTVR
jgi:hypothetical protein